MTKEEVQYKLMECKKLYTTCSDTFFKIYNPEYYTVISDTLESMEEDIEEFESCEVYEDISKRLDNFINVIQNMDFFYKAGKYEEGLNTDDSFTKGVRRPSQRKQDMAREQMDKKALDFLDEYTNGVLDYIKHSLYGISISRGLLKVYKHVNYVSALSFCGSDDAGATIVIRVRASVKPKEVKTKETHHE